MVKPMRLNEHALAHHLLDGLRGLEIGAAAHNPFGLNTRNVAPMEDFEFYAEEERRRWGLEPAPIDCVAYAWDIPVPAQSEDFILSSHVVEHLPDVIRTFVEWDRVVRNNGCVLMIIPLKESLENDAVRPLTTLEHFIEDYEEQQTLDTHPFDDISGGRMGHYHTFTPDSALAIVDYMHERGLLAWELIAREDVDTKVGNGFTLAFRVSHPVTAFEEHASLLRSGKAALQQALDEAHSAIEVRDAEISSRTKELNEKESQFALAEAALRQTELISGESTQRLEQAMGELAAIYSRPGFQALEGLRRLSERLAPWGSFRAKVLAALTRFVARTLS